MQKMNVTLASASPRRREILCEMGLAFNVSPADVDEENVKAAFARTLVKRLSALKAKSVYEKDKNSAVIGADTVVAYRNRIYGKPHSKQRAVEMISSLNGRWHRVYTGVTIAAEGKLYTFCVKSSVKFKKLTKEQITAYVEECDPLDKAGAYGIQDRRIVEKYKGSYTNIVGLPKEKLAEMLARVGVV